MIECVEENVYYKKRCKKRCFFPIFFIIVLLVGAICYYRFVITENIFKICSDNAYAYSTESLNAAVVVSLNDRIKYSDLIKVEKNSSGDIVMLTADSYKINVINKDVATKTEIILKEKLAAGVPIPFFSFLGIQILSGYGKTIYYKSVSVSSVECSFDSEFKSVGINQTLHSIFVTVKTKVKIDAPLREVDKEFFSKILISETVLMGEVPEVYLNGGLFTSK